MSQRLRLCRPLLPLLSTVADPLENLFPVLVQLQFCDLHLAGCNANGNALTIALLACDPLDVHDVFQAVYRSDLALTILVRTAFDYDFVVFADGDGSNLSVGSQASIEPIFSPEDNSHCAFLSTLQSISVCDMTGKEPGN